MIVDHQYGPGLHDPGMMCVNQCSVPSKTASEEGPNVPYVDIADISDMRLVRPWNVRFRTQSGTCISCDYQIAVKSALIKVRTFHLDDNPS